MENQTNKVNIFNRDSVHYANLREHMKGDIDGIRIGERERELAKDLIIDDYPRIVQHMSDEQLMQTIIDRGLL